MPITARHRPWTLDDFLDWERQQADRHEFVDGMIRMMVGGSHDHNTIIANLHVLLGTRLSGSGCRTFAQGSKLKVDQAVFYPDVMVTCETLAPKDDVVSAPALLFEVLSASSLDHDTGRKWLHYQGISALEAYFVLSQDMPEIAVYRRQIGGWSYTTLSGMGAVLDTGFRGISLPLAEIYRHTSGAQAAG